jgi:uncharacterized surface protein with fasciclin (FAS1) repeats
MRTIIMTVTALVTVLALALPAAAAKPDFAAAAKPGDMNLVELAAGAGLTNLIAAVQLSDAECDTSFAATLSGKRGQFTVFAPTNAAFEPVFDLLSSVDQETLCAVLPDTLAYHVTTGRHHSQDVLSSDGFTMLNGEYAPIEGGTIAGANIILTDFSASNGIAHVIDAVIFP